MPQYCIYSATFTSGQCQTYTFIYVANKMWILQKVYVNTMVFITVYKMCSKGDEKKIVACDRPYYRLIIIYYYTTESDIWPHKNDNNNDNTSINFVSLDIKYKINYVVGEIKVCGATINLHRSRRTTTMVWRKGKKHRRKMFDLQRSSHQWRRNARIITRSFFGIIYLSFCVFVFFSILTYVYSSFGLETKWFELK